MPFPSIDCPYRISSASTTYMHTCLLRATFLTLTGTRGRGGCEGILWAKAAILVAYELPRGLHILRGFLSGGCAEVEGVRHLCFCGALIAVTLGKP
jgi:hypothetical protein